LTKERIFLSLIPPTPTPSLILFSVSRVKEGNSGLGILFVVQDKLKMRQLIFSKSQGAIQCNESRNQRQPMGQAKKKRAVSANEQASNKMVWC